MGYDSSTGIISAPVNTDDVASALGSSSHDVATLCSHTAINTASVCKPVRYDTPCSLTDAQRVGTSSDQTDGYFYGVRLAGAASSLEGLHDCNYDYRRVRPGTDWSRLDDFVGYNHKARFNPQGSTGTSGLIDDVRGLSVTISYDVNHTAAMGINIADVWKKTNPDVKEFGQFYPFALVTVGTQKWVSALQTAEGAYSTLQSGGGWVRDWRVPLQTLAAKTTLTAGNTVTVTVFFMKNLYPDGQSDTGYFKTWRNVSGTLYTGLRAYTCPGAVAKTVTLQRMTKLVAKATAAGLNSANAFTITFQSLGDAESGKTYRFDATFYKTGPQDVHGTLSVTRAASAISGSFTYTASMEVLGRPSGTYYAQWAVYEGSGVAKVCNSGTLQFTV